MLPPRLAGRASLTLLWGWGGLQVRETSLELTMRRLLGDEFDVWRGAASSAAAADDGSSASASPRAAAPESQSSAGDAAGADAEPPFTAEDVAEALDLVPPSEVASCIEQLNGLPRGSLAKHQAALTRMLAAATAPIGDMGGDDDAAPPTKRSRSA